jgi:hypothetical protein
VAAAPVAASGLHHADTLDPLLRLFVHQCTVALAELRVPHGPLEVVSCRAELGSPGQEPPFRATTNAYLAGLYVVRAPGGCRAEFEDPRSQAHLIAPPRTTTQTPDAPVAILAAPAGTLLVFPAWLRQRVPSPPGGGEQLTLSLGLLFGGFAESIARPKWKGHKQ